MAAAERRVRSVRPMLESLADGLDPGLRSGTSISLPNRMPIPGSHASSAKRFLSGTKARSRAISIGPYRNPSIILLK